MTVYIIHSVIVAVDTFVRTRPMIAVVVEY